MNKYGSTQIQKIVKITKMQAVHWAQTGAVIPYQDARGRSARRKFNDINKIEFGICRELNRLGIPPHVMADTTAWLRSDDSVLAYKQEDTGEYVDWSEDLDPKKIIYERLSVWRFIELFPKTRNTLLVIHYGKDSSINYGLFSLETFKRYYELAKFQTILVINIRALIEELGGI